MRRQVEELRDQARAGRRGGSDVAMARHVARGKLPARERIARLIDPQTPFLELSALAAHDMYGGDVPSASLVAGIGRISGRDCMVDRQ